MTTQKLEYDSNLGGNVVLGSHVPTYRYAASVLQEIKTLFNEVQHPESTKLVFQKLPKHMRRRAMSHHPKRLPRKYREAHKAQMAKAGKPNLAKRPSRKYRRRPKNLLRDYLRRQRRHIWLETHIWHAKRFHMINRWGYRLPYSSCDKTYRACYRATSEHCLLQDISYYACLELRGQLRHLKAGFERLSSKECGLGITAKTYLSGRREGSIELFRDRQYPNGALGLVNFMWRPDDAPNADENLAERTLWIWLHPSAHQVIMEELISVFELKSLKNVKVPITGNYGLVQSSPEDQTKAKKVRVKQQRRVQFMTRTLAFEKIKRYANEEKTIMLSDLKDNMIRFRLTGPLSQCVLAEVFKPHKIDLAGRNWFNNMLVTSPNLQNINEMQANYWDSVTKLHSPNELLSNMIIGLNIVDPRLQKPKKRSKAFRSTESATSGLANALMLNASNILSVSVLWNTDIRDHVSSQILSTHAYCKLREQHAIVPGAPCRFERDLQPVPIILIQRPGSQQSQYKRLGYGCGWDVIAPAGYGMIIWMTLIMWGAKPGGLREFDSIARESGYEQPVPDTIWGRQKSALTALEMQTKYFRIPPNKRCNYRKFAVVSPFRAPFAQLVRDWLPDALTSISSKDSDETKKTSFHIIRNRQLLQRITDSIRLRNVQFPSADEIPVDGLIQIQLRLLTRGKLSDNALICLPTQTDFKRQLKQIKHDDQTPIYSEPLVRDPNEQLRHILRFKHKRHLKRLRARRIRDKRHRQEVIKSRSYIGAANTGSLVARHFTEMCNLWLPVNATESLMSVRKQGTREVFGYVTTASFSFTEATVSAVGYVTVAGLRALLTLCHSKELPLKQPPMCLVRDTKTRDYRFATIKANVAVSSPI